MPRQTKTQCLATLARSMLASQASQRVNSLRAMGWTVQEVAEYLEATPQAVRAMGRGEQTGTPVQRALLAVAIRQTSDEAGHHVPVP